MLRVRSGRSFRLPLFLPVYQPTSPLVPSSLWHGALPVEGCILNAFFLYKKREVREAFEAGRSIREHIGFDGFIMTDSGAFQGFSRPLHLDNKKIIAFQDLLGADVISPLDLVSGPGDGRKDAEGKMLTTEKRIAEGLRVAERTILAGVQQGGRFLDLRRRSMEGLVRLGVEYAALGSLVPFFNKNHDLAFVLTVIREAREIAGPDLPIHVYGAGDPCELPFLAWAGADIFDSASYGHYAEGGWYMTPYGALNSPQRLHAGEYHCGCPWCAAASEPWDLTQRPHELAAHNLWTILQTMERIREARQQNTMPALISEVLERHQAWFPESALQQSWEETLAGQRTGTATTSGAGELSQPKPGEPEWRELLLAELVAELTRDYRLTEVQARKALDEEIVRNQATQQLGRAASLKQARKARAYKELRTEVRRRVYYQLRQYKREEDETGAPQEDGALPGLLPELAALCRGHRSTAERLADLAAFREFVLQQLPASGRVLDVGCGLVPLLLGEVWPGGLGYVAVDRDAAVIATLQECKERLGWEWLFPVQADIRELPEHLGQDEFALGLVLKVLPVVERQEPHLVEVLLGLPCQRWLWSGSRVALAKRRDIEQRERRTLGRLMKAQGLVVGGELVLSEEFILAVEAAPTE